MLLLLPLPSPLGGRLGLLLGPRVRVAIRVVVMVTSREYVSVTVGIKVRVRLGRGVRMPRLALESWNTNT